MNIYIHLGILNPLFILELEFFSFTFELFITRLICTFELKENTFWLTENKDVIDLDI